MELNKILDSVRSGADNGENMKDTLDELKEIMRKNPKKGENVISSLSDENLKLFVPDVYVKKAMDINTDLLWNKGIRLITFDIDDTLIPQIAANLIGVPKWLEESKKWFKKLKKKGFRLVLLTNSNEVKAKILREYLDADGALSKARKPSTKKFRKAFEKYGKGLDKSQMAHVGNSQSKDVFGGNCFGTVTCMVREDSLAAKITNPVSKAIRKELKKRNMWRKHHLNSEEDQYYQLGEKQQEMCNFPR